MSWVLKPVQASRRTRISSTPEEVRRKNIQISKTQGKKLYNFCRSQHHQQSHRIASPAGQQTKQAHKPHWQWLLQHTLSYKTPQNPLQATRHLAPQGLAYECRGHTQQTRLPPPCHAKGPELPGVFKGHTILGQFRYSSLQHQVHSEFQN